MSKKKVTTVTPAATPESSIPGTALALLIESANKPFKDAAVGTTGKTVAPVSRKSKAAAAKKSTPVPPAPKPDKELADELAPDTTAGGDAAIPQPKATPKVNVDKAARKAATKRDLDLRVATGNLRESEVDKKLAEQEAADEAGDREDANPVPATLVDGDTPLPEDERLIGRNPDGRPHAPLATEAFIRFPITGLAAGMRSWAAYYAAQFGTLIDVVSVEGKLIERFDGRGAKRKPNPENKPRIANGAPAQRRGTSIITHVHSLIVKDPTITTDGIVKALADRGITTKPGTIALYRSETLEALNFVKAAASKDKKKPDPNAKPLKAISTLRQHMAEHPDATTDDLVAVIAKAGLPALSASTIGITRTTVLSVIKQYNENKN